MQGTVWRRQTDTDRSVVETEPPGCRRCCRAKVQQWTSRLRLLVEKSLPGSQRKSSPFSQWLCVRLDKTGAMHHQRQWQGLGRALPSTSPQDDAAWSLIPIRGSDQAQARGRSKARALQQLLRQGFLLLLWVETCYLRWTHCPRATPLCWVSIHETYLAYTPGPTHL